MSWNIANNEPCPYKPEHLGAYLHAVRGRMLFQLDAHGQPIGTAVKQSSIKHVFTVSWNTSAVFKPDIQYWEYLLDWDTTWDIYIGDPEARRALGKLTGSKLPHELYLMEILLERARRSVPQNGGGQDGPFALTTHASINTPDKLRLALSGLHQDVLNAVLHSSHVRTLNP